MKKKKSEFIFLFILIVTPCLVIIGYCNENKTAPHNQTVVSSENQQDMIQELIKGLVYVEGGCFQMGCGDWSTDCRNNERPVHEVCVNSFWIGKHEITQAQWEAFMDNNPSVFKLGKNHPVENITWIEIQEFIKRINKKVDKDFRLPTEAEWEFAVRDRGKNIRYPWGNILGKNNANCRTCGSRWDFKSTSPVGSFKPNNLGIFDMSGNVYEWCQDYYSADYYKISPKLNPLGPLTSHAHSTRGASWRSRVTHIRTTNRAGSQPTAHLDHLGFRIVLPEIKQPL
jgi:formylglycine-generating enzyme required for sulfatase activity